MRKIREILRLRRSAGLSIRQISASTKASVGAIQKLLTRAEALGLGWPLPPELDDNQLARCFYPGADTRVSARYQVPDWSVIHQELKRKGVTKQLLWEEYTQQYPNRCYSYSQFCDRTPTGRACKSAPCASSTRPVRNVLSITVDPRHPSSVPTPARSISAGVRGGAGGVQLHLCRGDPHTVLAGLAKQPCAGVRVLWGLSRDRRPGLCSREHNR